MTQVIPLGLGTSLKLSVHNLMPCQIMSKADHKSRSAQVIHVNHPWETCGDLISQIQFFLDPGFSWVQIL